MPRVPRTEPAASTSRLDSGLPELNRLFIIPGAGVGVTIVGGKLGTPSGLEMSRPESGRLPEIDRKSGEHGCFGEKSHGGLCPIFLDFGDREIRSQGQNKRPLALILPVFLVNKHYTHKRDAHPLLCNWVESRLNLLPTAVHP